MDMRYFWPPIKSALTKSQALAKVKFVPNGPHFELDSKKALILNMTVKKSYPTLLWTTLLMKEQEYFSVHYATSTQIKH